MDAKETVEFVEEMTMKKSIITILLAMGIIGAFTGCKSNPDPENGMSGSDGAGMNAEGDQSGVDTFYYAYHGSIGGDSYSYSVNAEDGKHFFVYESMLYPDYGELTREVDDAFLDQLTQLYQDCHLAAWDGFDKTNEFVLDGDGFSLSITFRDGKSLSAYGSNSTPNGYKDFCEKMEALFSPLKQEMLEEKRQEKIAEGISGKLEFMMVNYMQRGASGSDKYEIFITMPGVREKNFDVQISSESGELLPEGTYQYYEAVEADKIDFAGIQALIEKYDLITWYNYDETDEDYANKEWFQMSFGFDDGKTLNAMGTKHPEHYEEFRKEFLELIIQMCSQIENKQ